MALRLFFKPDAYPVSSSFLLKGNQENYISWIKMAKGIKKMSDPSKNMCVCVWEREREREKKNWGLKCKMSA